MKVYVLGMHAIITGEIWANRKCTPGSREIFLQTCKISEELAISDHSFPASSLILFCLFCQDIPSSDLPLLWETPTRVHFQHSQPVWLGILNSPPGGNHAAVRHWNAQCGNFEILSESGTKAGNPNQSFTDTVRLHPQTLWQSKIRTYIVLDFLGGKKRNRKCLFVPSLPKTGEGSR